MSLLQMSLAGSVMILLILAVRAVSLHKLSKCTFLVLWSAAAIRLLNPFSVPSQFSVYTLLGKLTQHTAPGNTGTWTVLLSDGMMPPPPSGAQLPQVPQAVSAVSVLWLVGAGVFLSIFLFLYGICFLRLRQSFPFGNPYTDKWMENHKLRRTIRFQLNDTLTSPLTYGILRPVIVMPGTVDWSNEEQNDLILEHEYCHIRRFDFLLKMIMAVTVCVHWFNPLVWVMYFTFNRDLELSCDQYVVGKYGAESRAQYARTLIAMEENRSAALSMSSEFHMGAAENRIKAVMRFSPPSAAKQAVAVTLVLIICLGFMTSAHMVQATAEPAESTLSAHSATAQASPAVASPPSHDEKTLPNNPADWGVPIAYTAVTRPFGNFIHPVLNTPQMHDGIDLAAPEGTPVAASRGGVVPECGYDENGGNYVYIDHGDGYVTVYKHLQEFTVSEGQAVSAGEMIGFCGTTGRSTGPHLHFGLYYQGTPVDPTPFIGA